MIDNCGANAQGRFIYVLLLNTFHEAQINNCHLNFL